MSALAVPALVPLETACPAAPVLSGVFRRLGVSLAVACAIPGLLFYVSLQTVGLVPAVLSAVVWAYGAALWRKVTGRPTSGLLLLAVTVLTVRTIFVLSTGNTFVYFLQPIAIDGIVALLFLASLASARPLVARIAADFYPMNAELAADPRVRTLFWRLSLMWGCIGLAKAGLGYWLLESLSMADFVLVKGTTMIGLTVAGVSVTVWAALVVLRRVGAHA